MEKAGIKNIIFDLGGVLLNIDYMKAIEAFFELGISREQLEYSQAEQSHLFDGLEVGKLTPKEFRDGLRQLSYLGLSDAEIDGAWNALILDMPAHRLALLKQLKGKYRLFMLSNTNIIHYEAYTKLLRDENGVDGLEPFFEKTYLSHEIGRRKPDVDTFKWVCEDAGIDPKETLFIDDSKQHIDAAQSMGLNAHWLTDGDVVDLFSNGELN